MSVVESKTTNPFRIVDVLRTGSLETIERDAQLTGEIPAPANPVQPITKFEELLTRLRSADAADIEETVLREISRHAYGDDDLARAILREQIVAILREKGRLSPAGIADAALARTTAPPSTPSLVRTIEPWPEPVEGSKLLDEIKATISRFVVLQLAVAEAISLWIIHTFVYDRFVISPRLLIKSPEKRCGKTTLLSLLAEVCNQVLSAANLSTAVMFRAIDAARPTLLVDEADTFLRQATEMRGIINAGHRRGGTVLRCTGDDNEPRSFNCYGPMAIATIGPLPDTIMDRSIVVPIVRRTPEEKVDRFRQDRVGELHDLARKIARWANDHADYLDLDPPMPKSLHDRAEDNWRVLVSIADRVGSDWPERARKAAVMLSAVAAEDDESARVMLLADIKTVFETIAAVRMSTTDLLANLHEMEDRPWSEWHGKPLTAHGLASQLRLFKIKSANIREGAQVFKGYKADDFRDAWGRYL